MDKFYSTSEAALLLGFSKDHFRRLILQGKIKATKVGNAWIINSNDLGCVKRRRFDKPKSDKGIEDGSCE